MSVTIESAHDGSVVVRIPLKRRTRTGGIRLMVVPDTSLSACDAHSSARDKRDPVPNDPVLKALGRAWRWKRLVDAGTSMADIAADENVHKSYLSRLLRLTALSPSISVAILDGKLPRKVLLGDLLESSEIDWSKQERRFAFL